MKSFDFETFFDDWGIETAPHGHPHRTSTFKYQVHCPLVGNVGSGFHLGVNPNGNACFRCGGSHSLYDLLGAWTHLQGNDLKKLITKYGSGYDRGSEKILRRYNDVLLKPPLIDLGLKHEKYLKRRGFNPEYLKHKYRLQSVLPIGQYGGRIYIPVIQNRREVAFTTRALNAEAKYKHSKDFVSICPINTCLYGIDDCQEDFVIVCEGVSDVWNFGANTVAIFGKSVSLEQLKVLVKQFKTIFILLDPDAYDASKKLKQKLSPYRKTINLVLKDKDPGELNIEERIELLQQIYKLKG
jgi:5S rRNA maturation endonuclease (ribonuclease M5)